jgi:hypothetical protein
MSKAVPGRNRRGDEETRATEPAASPCRRPRTDDLTPDRVPAGVGGAPVASNPTETSAHINAQFPAKDSRTTYKRLSRKFVSKMLNRKNATLRFLADSSGPLSCANDVEAVFLRARRLTHAQRGAAYAAQ